MKGNFVPKGNWYIYVLYLLLALLAYHHLLKPGYTFDYFTSATSFNNGGLSGAAATFSYKGFLPACHVFEFTVYSLFGLHYRLWLLLGVALHALNGTLLFMLLRKLLAATSIQHVVLLALSGSLLFLLSPFQIEPVSWGEDQHYLVIGILMLGILLGTLSYASQGQWWWLLALPLMYFVAVFMLEVANTIPFMLLGLIWLAPEALIKTQQRKSLFLKIIVPQFLLTITYFISSKLVIGIYFGHYGGTPLNSVSVVSLVGNYIKYLLKLLIFLPHLHGSFRDALFNGVRHPIVGWAAALVLVAGFVATVVSWKKLSNNTKLLLLLFYCASLAIGPMLVMDYEPMFSFDNGRYTYFISMFFYPLLIAACYRLFKPLAALAWVGYLAVSLVLLSSATAIWYDAGHIRNALLRDFRWYNHQKVVVLAMPNYYQGINVLNSFGHELATDLKVVSGKDLDSGIVEVLQYNMVTTKDAVSFSVTNDSTIEMGDYVSGSWFWYKGFGAGGGTTSAFDFTSNGMTASLHLHHPAPNSVYIYNEGEHWKELKVP